MKRLILLAALMAFPVGAHDEGTIHSHPFRNNQCDKGEQIVYRIVVIPCDRSQMFGGSYWEMDGQDMCQHLVEEKWTDWPQCDGHVLTPVRSMVLDMGHTEVTE